MVIFEDGCTQTIEDFLKYKKESFWQVGWYNLEETFEYKDYTAEVNYRTSVVTFTKDNESRSYDDFSAITKVKQQEEYLFIYYSGEGQDRGYIQFKFEDGNFLVGDDYNSDNEFICEYACYIFGEN